ncbi:DNA-binding response regulator [Paenibacillus aurantiacus]|uniref:DNA-binding response regulator n=1 Tax=Paenibacillus aurantiacus TaxID=1936118 RepID=A0ABV5KUC8_9BACL
MLLGDFKIAFEEWLARHRIQRKGEGRNRIVNGLGHAENLFLEKVWWPAFGQLAGLHPEYEIRDFRDGSRFIDFAYIRGGMRIGIEIDGYGPHWRDLSRWQFADHLMRQNQLVIDGWLVIRFAFDDVCEKPRRCQQALQQLFGKWGSEQEEEALLNSYERDVLRLALQQEQISVRMASEYLRVTTVQARRLLRMLKDKRLIVPVNQNSRRVRYYKMASTSQYRQLLG